MARRRSIPAPPPVEDRGSVLSAALKNAGLSPAAEEIDDVIVVPTGLYNLDAATRVGGIPVEMITTIFGPSQGGKTSLALAICRAFIQAGGVAVYIDAERRLRDADHVARMMGFVAPDGSPLPKEEWNPSFRIPPKSRSTYYEDAVETLNRLASESRALADAHPWYPGGVVIIDSLDSLVPENEMRDAMKDIAGIKNKASADGVTSGRLGQRSAAMNSSWIKVLANQAAFSRLAVVLICQESVERIRVGGGEISHYYPRGGRRIEYYSSLMIRVTSSTVFKTGFYGWKRAAPERGDNLGTCHHIEIRKTSLSNLTVEGGSHIPATYWQSNGRGPSPAGIDYARDLLETSLDLGVLVQAGTRVKWGDLSPTPGETLAPTFIDAHARLASDPEVHQLVASALQAEIDRRNDSGEAVVPIVSDSSS